MRFDDILSALGADDQPLPPREQELMTRDGCVALPALFDQRQVAAFRELTEGFLERYRVPVDEGDGASRIYQVVDLDPLFDLTWSHPRLLAAARWWLKDEFKPMSVNYRSAAPGMGQQGLHSDFVRTADGATSYCQAIVALVDFTEHNGPPRLVPGTHVRTDGPADHMADTRQAHPHEIKLLGPAGTAFFFDGNAWHSGTLNRSAAPRPALHVGFMLRHADNAFMESQRGTIRRETYERLTRAQRNLLDFKVVDPDYDRRTAWPELALAAAT
jgi:hypothetical protein